MKKIFVFCVVFTVLCFKGFSQETNKANVNSQNFNEIKLNALLIVIGAFDISYERTLNKRSGVGITTFITYDSENISDLNYFIAPYYRHYFGKKHAAGFFLEGFGMLNSQNINRYTGQSITTYFFGIPITYNETKLEKTSDFALGIGLGSKWLIKEKFIAEINIGVGKNLFEDYNDAWSNLSFIGKGAISIGYRF